MITQGISFIGGGGEILDKVLLRGKLEVLGQI